VPPSPAPWREAPRRCRSLGEATAIARARARRSRRAHFQWSGTRGICEQGRMVLPLNRRVGRSRCLAWPARKAHALSVLRPKLQGWQIIVGEALQSFFVGSAAIPATVEPTMFH
jgi:hypothetical protein